MPQLVEQFASKAAMKQRRGRAGRVREGTCYKLISFSTHEALKEHSDPEITRVALDQTLLQLMFLGVERGTGTFTSTLLDPPSKDSIDAAIFSLKKLGAIEPGRLEGEMSLTSLGVHLAGIPAPPTIGKRKFRTFSFAHSELRTLLTSMRLVLVMGSILGCREAAVVMAAGISVGRSPFIRVDTRTDKTDFASESREVSTEKSKVQDILDHRAPFIKEAGNSDHALLVSVFLKWKGTEMSLQRNFCESIGLNVHILRDISQQAKQLDSTLISLGFVASSVSDRHGTSLRILHACAVAAMSPSQLVKVRRPATKYLETAEGAKEKDGEARELKFFVRTGNEEVGVSDETLEERVFIHPSSTNFQTGTYSCPFLVYHSLVRTSKPFLRDVTECSAYAMLLFGGDLEIRASQGIVVIDEWATLSTNARIGSLMGGLRRRMDVLLADKIKNPSLDIANSQEMMLIAKLVMTDGLGT